MAWYSVIQWEPHGRQDERLNLGVLVWCKGAHAIAIDEGCRRVERACGPEELAAAMAALEGMAYRLRHKSFVGLGILQHFCRRLGNNIQMTAPRYCREGYAPEDMLKSLIPEMKTVCPTCKGYGMGGVMKDKCPDCIYRKGKGGSDAT